MRAIFLTLNTINELLILILSVVIELIQLQTLKLNDGAANFRMMFGNRDIAVTLHAEIPTS
jgi:hypothetical protein